PRGPENRNRLAQRLEVVEHEKGGLREAEVLDRLGDLTVLDQPQAIAGVPRGQQALAIEQLHVPESTDQEPAPGRAYHLVDGNIAPGHAVRDLPRSQPVPPPQMLHCVTAFMAATLEHSALDPCHGPGP